MDRKPDLEIIRSYLQWWDPLNIIEDLVESGNVLEEYDSYALEIHKLLEEDAGIFRIVALLEDIQVNRMGLDEVDRNRDRIFGEGLIICYREHTDRFY